MISGYGLDVEEDYDFIADVKRRKEMNMNTRKGVKKMRIWIYIV